MSNLRQQLPPLDALVMFEASARLSSFTAAADELNITQAAVSRQIRLLEENLNLRLFIRSRRGVQLSQHGRELQRIVSSTLTQLAKTAVAMRQASPARLTVAMDQSIAGLWLTPRLPQFQQSYPDIGLRLLVSDEQADCLKEDVDVAIVHGDGVWPGFDARLLFRDEVFPVCSPSYVHSHEPIMSAADLASHTLIEHEDEHWAWINWTKWQHLNDVELDAEPRRLIVNNYSVLIQATCDGQGIALGWRQLVERLLASGQLLRPLPGVTATEYGYYVLVRDKRIHTQSKVFVDWVLDDGRCHD